MFDNDHRTLVNELAKSQRALQACRKQVKHFARELKNAKGLSMIAGISTGTLASIVRDNPSIMPEEQSQMVSTLFRNALDVIPEGPGRTAIETRLVNSGLTHY